MNAEVKMCLDARLGFFEQYCTVPEAMKTEVDAFCQAVTQLAEKSPDAASFEAAFNAEGLSDKFNGLVTKCPPKPYEMTKQDKEYVREVKKQMWEENKGEILKDAVYDAADSIMMKVESEAIAQRREQMIGDGTLDDYTRTSNAVEDIGWLGRSIGKLFGKKK